MNQSQIKYIVNRLQEEYERKKEQVCKKYPDYNTTEARARFINANKLPLKYTLEELRKKCFDGWSLHYVDLFDTQTYMLTTEELKKRRQEKLDALRTRYNTLKDNIMLGDAKDALDQLNDFIKEEF